jgi:hypothetical protein
MADLLRGFCKHSDYGKVILRSPCCAGWTGSWRAPRTPCRRSTSAKTKAGLNPEPFLVRTAGQIFYDTPSMDLRKLMGHQDHVRNNPIRGGTGTPPKRGCLLDCPPSRVGQISFGPRGTPTNFLRVMNRTGQLPAAGLQRLVLPLPRRGPNFLTSALGGGSLGRRPTAPGAALHRDRVW